MSKDFLEINMEKSLNILRYNLFNSIEVKTKILRNIL